MISKTGFRNRVSEKTVLTSTAVALLLDLSELASDVCRVAVQHGRVPVADLAGVVQHDYLHNRQTIKRFGENKMRLIINKTILISI